MTSFILIEASPWTVGNILGVYDTPGRADGAKKQHLESPAGHRSSYAILPIETNTAPENHFPKYGKRGE